MTGYIATGIFIALGEQAYRGGQPTWPHLVGVVLSFAGGLWYERRYGRADARRAYLQGRVDKEDGKPIREEYR